MMSPGGAQYDTYIMKLTTHELGHVFGMADVYEESNQQMASIMDQGLGTNDQYQGMPTQPTECDKTHVWDDYAETAGGNGVVRTKPNAQRAALGAKLDAAGAGTF
jgi:hypothetical protein